MVRAILDCHLPYYSPTLVVLLIIYTVEYHHQPIIFLWINYVIFPIIDWLCGNDEVNPTPEEEKILSKQFKWILPVLTFAATEWLIFFWSFSYLQRNEIGIMQFILFAFTVSHVNGEGFLISHELFHKKNIIYKIIGTFDLIKSLNMWFYFEHVYGHHKYVATPEDPATAKLNQRLSDFAWQSIKGSLRKSWERETKMLRKKNLSEYSIHNRILQFILIEIAFVSFIFYWWGIKCGVFFLVQAYISMNILEGINYIRHYGLVRKKLPNGEYEPVGLKHSWNASQFFQNCLLLKLQRHSDHHANPYKPYQCLSSAKEAPNLPCGYSVCLLAINFPTYWFSIINPLVESTNKDGKPTKEQMEKSEKALRTWMMYEIGFVSAFALLVLFVLS